MRGRGLVLAATVLLAACSGWQGDDNDGIESADYAAEESNLSFMEDVPADQLPPDTIGLPMKEVMAHVFQYAGQNIWKWQGFITDEAGERSLFPKDDAEWQEAENAGLSLAELTNILLLPGRRVDDPRWAKAVADVRTASLRIARAAEQKDQDRFFTEGGRLDEACESCHLAFAPWSAKPGLRHVAGQAISNVASNATGE